MFSRLLSRSNVPVVALQRGFAAAAGKHEPPKKIYGTIGRYAEAVYTSSSKAGSLEKVEQELLAFSNLLKKQPGFASYLANPTVPRGEKISKLSGILDESKISHITRNLFITLSANGRIGEADKVINAFADLMNTSRGLVSATIVSAEPLNEKTVEVVKKAVQGIAGKGKQVDLTLQVDSKIMGGLKVIVGDRFIDLSVATRISELSGAIESQ